MRGTTDFSPSRLTALERTLFRLSRLAGSSAVVALLLWVWFLSWQWVE